LLVREMQGSGESSLAQFSLACSVCVPVQSQHNKQIEEHDPTTYVCEFAISPKIAQPNNTTLEIIASADSSNSICLHSRQNLEFVGRITGHTDTITDLLFDKNSPFTLWSSSKDSTIKCWDLRTQSVCHTLQARRPVGAFDISGRAVAAGCAETITFWDISKLSSSPIASFTESHTEEITHMSFHPTVADKLFTASQDGLVCVFDMEKSNEDDALLTVLPTEISIEKFGFAGPMLGEVYIISSDHTLSIWNVEQCTEQVKFTDVRQLTQEKMIVDYLIDCHYQPTSNTLYVISGDVRGGVGILEVSKDGLTPVARLSGGHNRVVRFVDWNDQDKRVITGGEDTKLCLWQGA